MNSPIKRTLLLPLALLLLPGGACNRVCGDNECIFTPAEWEVIDTLSPLPDPPTDPTNRWDGDPRAIELGRKLFFETRYSNALSVASTLGAEGEKGKVSCAACHDPESGFSDTRSTPNNMSLGVSWTTRNAPPLVNTVYYKHHGWDLRQDTLWNQGTTTPETGTNSAGDRCEYARMLYQHYKAEYNGIFTDTLLPEALDPARPMAMQMPAKCRPSTDPMNRPGAWETMSATDKEAINRVMSNQGKAVAAYESKLISRNAPFDHYVAGDRDAISGRAKAGLKLFIGKAACIDCHQGPFFTDHKAHNLGLPQDGPNVPKMDEGYFNGLTMLQANTFTSWKAFSDNRQAGEERRLEVEALLALAPEAREGQRGQFRTQTLRNLTQSAPYMHTGMFPTLRKVVEYYNKGGEQAAVDGKLFSGTRDRHLQPLHLTEIEIDNLVAFLETLTGEAVPAALRANPFK